MKTIILFFLLAITINAQSNLIILMSSDPTVAGIDTIPSQFTFTDVTDAALSSYNQAYIVVAGCDSARFYTNGTDSLKLGALGTYDVSEIWADAGDSVYMGNIASGTNSTTTNKTLYSASGTPTDVFSVTTVADSWTPNDLNPIIYFVYDDDSLVVSGSKTVRSVTLNGYSFVDDTADVNGKIVQTDSSIYFGTTAGVKKLLYTDAGDSPFDLGLNDCSVDAWYYYSGNGISGTLLQDGQLNFAYWVFGTKLGDGVIVPRFTAANTNQDTVSALQYNSQTDSLEVGWYHLAFTLDRNGNRYMYVDSVLVTNAEATGIAWANISAVNFSNAEATQIGADNIGHIASIRYYDYIISPAEIKQLYEYGVANGHR